MNALTTTKTDFEIREMNIHDIESLTREEAESLAILTGEVIDGFKGHTLYLVDFGSYFGFSCLVFWNDRHIYYANDYELHHNGKTRDELELLYLNEMNNKLYEEADIAKPLTDYQDYKHRLEFMMSYYGMRRQYQSIFGIEKKPENAVYDPVSFAYYDSSEKPFIDRHVQLYEQLEAAVDAMKDNTEYWIGAFYYEMVNHEYGINWEGDFDTLSAFGDIDYYEQARLDDYFNVLGFNDVQRNAYYKARNLYYENNSGNF